VTKAGWDLMEAISAAMVVLGFFELPAEDQPPEHYWHSRELVDEWFVSVKARYERKAKGLESIETSVSEDDFVNEEVAALRG